MTAIAHMPDGAAGNGTTDDTAALQAMFDAVENGGQVLIPDGVFRVTSTIRIPVPCMVWCSPGAHIKGDFAGTDPVIHGHWSSANGGQPWVFFDGMHWQGGTISRLNRNGPCLRGSTWIEATIQDLRTLRGSPHIQLDAPSVKGAPFWGALVRVVNCRGYDGGPLGLVVGNAPAYPAKGQMNGEHFDHCYFEGDGSAGSIGCRFENGGGFYINGCVFKNYEKGLTLAAKAHVAVVEGTKYINLTGQVFSGGASTDTGAFYYPRGWQAGKGAMTAKARDPQGVYL